MTTQNTRFETVEDMVNYLTSLPYRSDTRFALRDRSTREWDNEEAGEAWQAESYALNRPFSSDFFIETGERKVYDEQGYNAAVADWKIKRDELESRRPTDRLVTYWTLEEPGYRGKVIDLSTTLGEQLDAVWTKRTPRYGTRKERTGQLTIAGMLKRLHADKGLTQAIDDAKAKAEHEKNVAMVNWQREQIRKHAAEIIESIKTAELGDESDQITALLENLANLQELPL